MNRYHSTEAQVKINFKKTIKRAELFQKALSVGVPHVTADSLAHYVVDRRPVGGFLRAVLASDLFGAYKRADNNNQRAMFNIVQFIHMSVPMVCYGDERRVSTWVTPTDDTPKMPWEQADLCAYCGTEEDLIPDEHGDQVCPACLASAQEEDLEQLADDERSEHDFAPGGPGTA